MAWTLLEDIIKAVVVFTAGYLFSTTWRALMNQTCLIKNCQRLAHSDRRGLCSVCYAKAKAKVDANQVTWERLAALGLCKVEVDPFDDAYSKAVRDQ